MEEEEEEEEENQRWKIPTNQLQSSSGGVGVSQLSRTVDNIHSAIKGPSAVWTDEKHRLYIDSLEASFVYQLHHAIALRDIVQPPCYSKAIMPTDTCNSSSPKFLVLQDGCSHGIDSTRIKPPFSDSLFIQANPWISHFPSAGKERIVACQHLQHGRHSSEMVYAGGTTSSSEQNPACSLCCHNSAGIVLEVSDQNFVDEDQERKT